LLGRYQGHIRDISPKVGLSAACRDRRVFDDWHHGLVTEDSGGPYPRMTLAAEGRGPSGERWSMQTGGPPEDYLVSILIGYPDGTRDGSGMSGPMPPVGSLYEWSARYSSDHPAVIRFLVWAHPKVRRVEVRSEEGEQLDLLPVKDDLSAGVTFFVSLLPWSKVASVKAFDSAGQLLPDIGGVD
jgi:hypothetical protein